MWTEQNKAAQQPMGTGSPFEKLGHTGPRYVKTAQPWWPPLSVRTGSSPDVFWQADTHLLVRQPGSAGHRTEPGSNISTRAARQSCHNNCSFQLLHSVHPSFSWAARPHLLLSTLCSANERQKWAAETPTTWGTESKHTHRHHILATGRWRVTRTPFIWPWARKKPSLQLGLGTS